MCGLDVACISGAEVEESRLEFDIFSFDILIVYGSNCTILVSQGVDEKANSKEIEAISTLSFKD
jgi:hypothetical protein